MICELLQKLARKGKTVISTIHSPSSAAFAFFDRLILMCDGNIVYQGEAKSVTRYFNMMGMKINKYQNPADFFMKILTISYPKTDEDQIKLDKLNNNYAQIQAPEVTKSIIELQMPELDESELHVQAAPWCLQFEMLNWRNFLLAQREPKVFLSRVLQNVVIALLTIAIYWDVGRQEERTTYILDITGSIFFITIFQMISPFFSTNMTFQIERPVFLREQAAKMYSISAYFTSKNIIEVPLTILLPLIMLCLVYWSIGYAPGADNFFMFYVALLFLNQAATGMGYFLSAICNNMVQASSLGPLLHIPMIQFSGLFANLGTISVAYRWLQWFSVMRYANEACMRAIWRDNVLVNGTDPDHDIFEHLTYTIGYGNCILGLFLLAIFFRCLSVYCLKKKISKFQ